MDGIHRHSRHLAWSFLFSLEGSGFVLYYYLFLFFFFYLFFSCCVDYVLVEQASRPSSLVSVSCLSLAKGGSGVFSYSFISTVVAVAI
jgi:hypothetical protein